jgi:hypothetical protein
MMRAALILAAMLVLAACAPWTKTGGTAEMLAADRDYCNDQALTQAPPEIGPAYDYGTGSLQPGYACLPGRGCVPTSGNQAPPGGAIMDKNAAARQTVFNQCMMKKGWTK